MNQEENSWTGKEERAIVPLKRSVRKVLKGVILMDDVLASKILNEMEEDVVVSFLLARTQLGQECVSVCLGNEREMFNVVVPTGFALLWRGISCGRAGMISDVLSARSRSTRRCK